LHRGAAAVGSLQPQLRLLAGSAAGRRSGGRDTRPGQEAEPQAVSGGITSPLL